LVRTENDDPVDVWCDSEEQNIECGVIQSFGCGSVSDVVRRGRLRWFGHVERKSHADGVSAVETWRLKEIGLHGANGKLRLAYAILLVNAIIVVDFR